MIRRLRLSLCAIFFGILALPALAHKASDSYLSLQVGVGDTAASINGQWDIALRDLDFAIGIDANGDGEITWGEVKDRHQAIAAYALSRLQLRGDGEACLAKPSEHLVDEHTDGAYAVLRFTVSCARPFSQLEIDYRLLFDVDPQHRGLLRFEQPGRLEQGGATRTAILSPEQPTLRLDVTTAGTSSRWGELRQYGREGIWHIWIGFDHVLFLISLLLPAVLHLRARAWQPVDAFRPAFWDVVKIVTAFTVAHSITLTLATLGVVSLPSRLVESAIAISVVLAAANNLYPVVGGSRWMVAFAFGLIHGFGFATVLADLGLRSSTLLIALIGFNVGVEIGQLAIVLLFLPIAYWIRATWTYRRMVVMGGSVVIILIAAIWFCERAFNLDLV
ncbi:MAG: HupE/UreJ family protein [Burkholderiales bacterium]